MLAQQLVRRFACRWLGSLVVAAALTAGAQAGIPGFRYEVQGSVDGSSFDGSVIFGTNGNMMRAGFQEGITSRLLTGFYSEVDLLLISFWNFDGSLSGGVNEDATGSGIRLFFGLLTFGSYTGDSTGDVYSFSGTFAEVFASVPPAPDRRASSPLTLPPHAALWRRTTSPVRL